MYGTTVVGPRDLKEIRIIKQIVSNGVTTNIYENGSVDRLFEIPPKKVILNKEESLKLFKEAQKEIEFAFKKKGSRRGARRWK